MKKIFILAFFISLQLASTCWAGMGTYADRVKALSFNKNGSTLAVLDVTYDNKNIVLLLDARSGKLRQKKYVKNVSTLVFDDEDRLVLVETNKSTITFRNFATDKVLKSTKMGVKRDIVASSGDLRLLLTNHDSFLDTETGRFHKLKADVIVGIAYGKYAAVYDGKAINVYSAAKTLLETQTLLPADIDNFTLDTQGRIYLTSAKPKMVIKIHRDSEGVPFESLEAEEEVDFDCYISLYNQHNKEVYRRKHVNMVPHSMATSTEFIAVGGLGDVTLYKRDTGEVHYGLDVSGGIVDRQVAHP